MRKSTPLNLIACGLMLVALGLAYINPLFLLLNIVSFGIFFYSAYWMK